MDNQITVLSMDPVRDLVALDALASGGAKERL
jgi:hypothetical protein